MFFPRKRQWVSLSHARLLAQLGGWRVRRVYFCETGVVVDICLPEPLVCARPPGTLGQVGFWQHGLQIRIVVHVEREPVHWLDMVQLHGLKRHLGVFGVFYVVRVHFSLNMLDHGVKGSRPEVFECCLVLDTPETPQPTSHKRPDPHY